MSQSPRLYWDLADWFHLLTAPYDYRDEAEYYGTRIIEAASGPVDTVLELGSGGGNNAVHMKVGRRSHVYPGVGLLHGLVDGLDQLLADVIHKVSAVLVDDRRVLTLHHPLLPPAR